MSIQFHSAKLPGRNVSQFHRLLLFSISAREETCGGLGMTKYVDSNETRRLSRLKNVKSSIGNKISHNGWLKRQLEKRRIENLRQRKEEAKRKPLGDGIQVETKVSRLDAVSKCGLKLKVTKKHEEMCGTNTRRGITHENNGSEISIVEPPQREMLDKPLESLLIREKKKVDVSNFPSSTRPPGDPSIVKSYQPAIKQTRQTSTTRLKKYEASRNKDKENNCFQANSTTLVEPTSKLAAEQEDKKKKGGTTCKIYLRDIDSLRREHANAIKMLEELDINEGNKRCLASGNDYPTGLSRGDYDVNNSPCNEMIKSSMHACSDDYVGEYCCITNSKNRLRSVNEDGYSLSGEDCNNNNNNNNGRAGVHEQLEYHDDSVRYHRSSICSSRSSDSFLSKDVEEIILCASSMVGREETENTSSDDSFLNNLTHLSISFRDEFDNEGENIEEQVDEDLGEYMASPI